MPLRFLKESPISWEQLQPLAGIWLRKIFLEDWSTKLIALAIAVTLWFGISGQQTPDTRPFSEIRLAFRVLPELEISNEPLRLVEVTLTGDKGKLDRLDKRDLLLTLDLSSYTQGERLVQLRPDNVQMEMASGNDLPPGLKIVDIQPNLILLKLEPREEREVQVKPEFEGRLPDGLEVYEDETVVSPAKVRLRGPLSFVTSIDSVSTEKILLDGRTGSFVVKQAAINLLNPKVTVLDTVVDVSVRVGPKRSTKTFDISASVPFGKRETISITISGPQTEMDKLTANDISVEFDQSSDNTLTPRPVLPEALRGVLTVKNVKPSAVSH